MSPQCIYEAVVPHERAERGASRSTRPRARDSSATGSSRTSAPVLSAVPKRKVRARRKKGSEDEDDAWDEDDEDEEDGDYEDGPSIQRPSTRRRARTDTLYTEHSSGRSTSSSPTSPMTPSSVREATSIPHGASVAQAPPVPFSQPTFLSLASSQTRDSSPASGASSSHSNHTRSSTSPNFSSVLHAASAPDTYGGVSGYNPAPLPTPTTYPSALPQGYGPGLHPSAVAMPVHRYPHAMSYPSSSNTDNGFASSSFVSSQMYAYQQHHLLGLPAQQVQPLSQQHRHQPSYGPPPGHPLAYYQAPSFYQAPHPSPYPTHHHRMFSEPGPSLSSQHAPSSTSDLPFQFHPHTQLDHHRFRTTSSTSSSHSTSATATDSWPATISPAMTFPSGLPPPPPPVHPSAAYSSNYSNAVNSSASADLSVLLEGLGGGRVFHSGEDEIEAVERDVEDEYQGSGSHAAPWDDQYGSFPRY